MPRPGGVLSAAAAAFVAVATLGDLPFSHPLSSDSVSLWGRLSALRRRSLVAFRLFGGTRWGFQCPDPGLAVVHRSHPLKMLSAYLRPAPRGLGSTVCAPCAVGPEVPGWVGRLACIGSNALSGIGNLEESPLASRCALSCHSFRFFRAARRAVEEVEACIDALRWDTAFASAVPFSTPLRYVLVCFPSPRFTNHSEQPNALSWPQRPPSRAGCAVSPLPPPPPRAGPGLCVSVAGVLLEPGRRFRARSGTGAPHTALRLSL